MRPPSAPCILSKIQHRAGPYRIAENTHDSFSFRSAFELYFQA